MTPTTIAHAATFTVTNLNDSGAGSLRQAILDADASAGADTITFSVSGTLTLGLALPTPTITDPAGLTIDGAGQAVIISGGTVVRVLTVNPGASLILKNLTIANGKVPSGEHGGGIFNGGTLTIDNSLFSDNATTNGYGGGIMNSGTLTVTNSTFSGNSSPGSGGGAIMNSGTMAISNSSFHDNRVTLGGNGGSIYNNSGTATITNSAFYANGTISAGLGNGGAIFINAGAVTITNSVFSGNSLVLGGGVYNLGTLTMTNDTFSGNDATGGGDIYNAAGTTTITNNTFSGNSTNPIYNAAGTVTLRNTIVSTGTAGGNCVGTITNGGNNIDDAATCGWGSANGSMSSTNPLLGALANNGGPTRTFALLPGSPAINGVTFNAPNGAPSTDQRGVPRPQGVRYDIGAVETIAQSGPSLVVNNLGDPGDGSCDYAPLGDCTLREAISAANALNGANTITFSVSGTIPLGAILPNIADAAGLTIDGMGQTVTISGGGAVRVMSVDADAALSLNNLTIANGRTSGVAGGGIMNSGTLTVTNSTFSGNSTTSAGGGIYNHSGATLTIVNSTFSANTSTSGGGGIYNFGGTLTIVNSTFSANTSTSGSGGGIYYDGRGTVTNSTFSGNSAHSGGGGIINFFDPLTIVNSTFSGNSAPDGSNVLAGREGTLTLRNTIVANGTLGTSCSSRVVNGGNNIDDGTTCGWGSADGSMSSTNPLLGVLANNGGPTQTFALLPGSPAIDGVTFNVPNSAPATDQRGIARPQGVRYDIGSFERVPNLGIYLPLLRK